MLIAFAIFVHQKFIVMEHEERKIAKVYAFVTLYTIILLVEGILLGFALGRQSVMMSERENVEIVK